MLIIIIIINLKIILYTDKCGIYMAYLSQFIIYITISKLDVIFGTINVL